MVAVRRAGWCGCSRRSAGGIGRIRRRSVPLTPPAAAAVRSANPVAPRAESRAPPRLRHHVPAPTERHRRVEARCRCARASALRYRSSRSRGRSACLREQRAFATRPSVAPQLPRERRLRQPVHSMAVCPSVLTAPHPLSGSRPNHPAALPPDHGPRSSPRTGQSRPARRQARNGNAQAPRTERRGPATPSTAAWRRRGPRDEPSGRRRRASGPRSPCGPAGRSLASIAAALVRTLGTRRIEGSAAIATASASAPPAIATSCPDAAAEVTANSSTATIASGIVIPARRAAATSCIRTRHRATVVRIVTEGSFMPSAPTGSATRRPLSQAGSPPRRR